MPDLGSCACGTGADINNMGQGDCLEELKVAKTLVFSQRTTSAGVQITADPTSALDLTYWNTLFQADDVNVRLLPLLNIEGFEPTQDEDTFDEAPSGRKELVSEGVSNGKCFVWVKQPNVLKAKIDNLRCKSLQMHIIDTAGTIIGEADTTGVLLAGRKIANNTLTSRVLWKDDAGNNKVEITWEYDRSSSDSKVDFIAASQMTPNDVLCDIDALVDVSISVTGTPTQTTFDFKLFSDFGGMNSRNAIGGLTLTELEIYNVTDSSSVAFITLTDVTSGSYIGTFASQDSSDVLRVQGITTSVHNGFDLKRLPLTTATV